LLQSDVYAYQIAYRVGDHAAMTSRFLGFMFIGVAIFYHHRRRLGTAALWAVSAMLYGVFWIQWSNAPNSAESLSMLVVNSYTLALIVFCVSYAYSKRWPASRVLSYFADVSFPLYVVHGVAGYVALGIMAAHGAGPIVAVVSTLAGALFISTLLHVGVELPTHRLGQRWARALTRVKDDRPVSPNSARG
jgi:peptidoglycan/LPS O-acetylase OafA/YrhL